eukprot:3936960-Rhodomonas_salina.1
MASIAKDNGCYVSDLWFLNLQSGQTEIGMQGNTLDDQTEVQAIFFQNKDGFLLTPESSDVPPNHIFTDGVKCPCRWCILPIATPLRKFCTHPLSRDTSDTRIFDIELIYIVWCVLHMHMHLTEWLLDALATKVCLEVHAQRTEARESRAGEALE